MTIMQGKDKMATNLQNELVGLYYYTLDYNMVNANNGRDSKVFGYVPTIQNINFNPFVNDDDYLSVQCDLDVAHWGSPTTATPKVNRLTSFAGRRKTLGSINQQEEWDSLSQDTETRLLQYPFKFYMLTDYMNPPVLIKPNLLPTYNDTIDINVMVGLSQASKYLLYVDGYKGDGWGNVEGLVNNNPLLYPVGSSAYSSFLASSQSTFNQSNNLALLENDKTLQQGNRQLNLDRGRAMANGIAGVGGNLASMLTGNIGGLGSAIQSGTNMYFDFQQNNMNSQNLQENTNFREYQIQAMALARKDDLLSTPRAIKSVGNDATFNVINARRRVDMLEYSIAPEYYQRITEFFKRYGYQVDKYSTPNIRSRKYWNFIKTANCEITSGKIPKDNIEEIKDIFNKGCTFWHMDNGAEVKNYQMSNMEVS